MEYTSLNGKGKTQGTISYTVTNVVDEGSTSSATMVMKYMDDKGKEAFNSEFTYTCSGNVCMMRQEDLHRCEDHHDLGALRLHEQSLSKGA